MGKIRKVGDKVKKTQRKVGRVVRPGFWKQVLFALTPKSYTGLAERKIRKGIIYIAGLLLASFIIMCIMAMPKIVTMPEYIETELAKFDKLNISIEAEMSSPVMITGEDPQIVIDTTGETTEMGSEKLLITKEWLFYKPYGRTKAFNISEFEDITSKKKEVSKALTLLAIILLPSILIASYMMFLVKYLITIIVCAVLLFIALRMAKKDLSFIKALNTAIYAATPMILIEVIFIPFNSKYLVPLFQFMGMNFYLITILAYLVLAGFGAYFAMKKTKKNKDEDYPIVEGMQWEF